MRKSVFTNLCVYVTIVSAISNHKFNISIYDRKCLRQLMHYHSYVCRVVLPMGCGLIIIIIGSVTQLIHGLVEIVVKPLGLLYFGPIYFFK